MAPGEKLDPLPDTFILQPPVFQPVSSHSDWEPPRSQGGLPSSGNQIPDGGMERPSALGPASPASAHRLRKGPPELSKMADQLIPTWVRVTVGLTGPLHF